MEQEVWMICMGREGCSDFVEPKAIVWAPKACD